MKNVILDFHRLEAGPYVFCQRLEYGLEDDGRRSVQPTGILPGYVAPGGKVLSLSDVLTFADRNNYGVFSQPMRYDNSLDISTQKNGAPRYVKPSNRALQVAA